MSSRNIIHLLLIVIIGLAAYSNTFTAPFQWDESLVFEQNPVVKDFDYFLHPSKAKEIKTLWPIYHNLKTRYVGYLTYAVSYRIHGLDVTGYHVVSMALHLFNSILVYLLVMLTFRTPFLSRSTLGNKHAGSIALFTALLFVSHPVQTEAVTYVIRFPALVTFFYLGAIVLYAKWRLRGAEIASSWTHRNDVIASGGSQTHAKQSNIALYLFSLLSAVLAMKTKENAFTLPLMVVLFEFSFFTGTAARRRIFLLPFLLTLLIIPFTFFNADAGIDSATRHFSSMPRTDYLFTQFRVVATYIRLLFLPINQNLDYDYRISHSLFEPEAFLSLLLIVAALFSGAYLFRRSYAAPELRFAAFGIFWFFLSLSVESSIIPIPMIICEYRVYLPSVGFFLLVVGLLFYFFEKRLPGMEKRLLRPALFVIIAVLATATYARNIVWKDTITLWEDVVRKSPRQHRAYTQLGGMYEKKGNTELALKNYNKALELQPLYPEAHQSIGRLYKKLGLSKEAIPHYKWILAMVDNDARLHFEMGELYMESGQHDEAIKHFEKSLALGAPKETHYNIGNAYKMKGLLDKMREHYRLAKDLRVDDK